MRRILHYQIHEPNYEKTNIVVRLLWIFCFRTRYSIPLCPWYGIDWPGLACADCIDTLRRVHTIGLLVERYTCRSVYTFSPRVAVVAYMSKHRLNNNKTMLNMTKTPSMTSKHKGDYSTTTQFAILILDIHIHTFWSKFVEESFHPSC